MPTRNRIARLAAANDEAAKATDIEAIARLRNVRIEFSIYSHVDVEWSAKCLNDCGAEMASLLTSDDPEILKVMRARALVQRLGEELKVFGGSRSRPTR